MIAPFRRPQRLLFNRVHSPLKLQQASAHDYSILSSTSKVLKPISPDVSTISCTVVDSMGTVRAVSKKFPRASFLQQNKLFPRDLRKIDSSNVDVAPSIAVRSNGILVNLLHIKALIKRNEVLVFDTASPQSAGRLSLFMYDLESKLKTKVVHGGMLGLQGTHYGYNTNMINQNYEFRALECILVNVMAVLETELRTHVEKVEKILNELDSQIDRTNLRDLLVYSKALTMFYQKSLLIRNTLDELLDNDEDLESMYLTDNYEMKRRFGEEGSSKSAHWTAAMPNITSNPHSDVHGKPTHVQDPDNRLSHQGIHDTEIDSIVPSESELGASKDDIQQTFDNVNVNVKPPSMVHEGSEGRDTGEVEMLLESYYKQCDEIVQQAETMINDIKSTEDIVNIILDANRNFLMVFELRIAIFTLGFTVATLLPAFYGMNLKNYIENSNIAFSAVVAASIFTGAAMAIFCLRRLRSVRRMTMVSSKQLEKFDRDTKKGFLDTLRNQKQLGLSQGQGQTTQDQEGRRKLQKEIVWKWLLGRHR